MRAYHTIAITAVILLGVVTKLFFFSVQPAEADARSLGSSAGDISRVQQNVNNLPIENIPDMTFVFSSGR